MMKDKGMMCWVKRASALVSSLAALNVGLMEMKMDLFGPLLGGMAGMMPMLRYLVGLAGLISLVCSVKWIMSSKC